MAVSSFQRSPQLFFVVFKRTPPGKPHYALFFGGIGSPGIPEKHVTPHVALVWLSALGVFLVAGRGALGADGDQTGGGRGAELRPLGERRHVAPLAPSPSFHLSLGGWVAGWLGGWVAGWLGGWVGGWMGAGLQWFSLHLG